MATIHDVAQQAGVSPTTVSRYLNHRIELPPGTSARIDDAIRALDYRPNLLAKRLSTGKTEAVGLVTPEIREPFFAELASAFEDEADRHGYTVFISSTRSSRAREVASLERLQDGHVDGLLLLTNTPDDGTLARLPDICQLADEYRALVMVDDSHAVGFLVPGGRGTPEHWGVESRVDIRTGTLGKALGGASGGYTAARGEIVAWLRQRSRPYLFSNTLAPAIAAAGIHVLDMLQQSDDLRTRLWDNAQFSREDLTRLGFRLVPGQHPIIPVMLGDARLAQQMAQSLLDEGVYVIGFSYPVVPHGKARIRTQMSAAHSREDLEFAVAAFAKVGRALGIIG